MAEGTPLERVQVVNSGARVQIPPSALEHPVLLCLIRGVLMYRETLEINKIVNFGIIWRKSGNEDTDRDNESV